MLIYDALVEQAKIRGIPADKMRGILREYLQILILKELCKTKGGTKLYFTGGTYLRLVHNLKRFSEDLDFNAGTLTKDEFGDAVNRIRSELKRINLDFRLKFRHWENIYAADLIFSEIEKEYSIASKYAKGKGIVIKLETNRPAWRIKKETKVISGFGEVYPCICTDIGALFADKIDALSKKTRARHLYDIIFMLSNKCPIDKEVLSALGIKNDPLNVISNRVNSFSKAELKKQAETLRPFLFEESDANSIINAHEVIPVLLEKYRHKD